MKITSSAYYCTGCDNYRDKDEDFQAQAENKDGELICDYCEDIGEEMDMDKELVKKLEELLGPYRDFILDDSNLSEIIVLIYKHGYLDGQKSELEARIKELKDG